MTMRKNEGPVSSLLVRRVAMVLALAVAPAVVGCAAPSTGEASGSTVQASTEVDAIEAELEALVAELEAAADQIELESMFCPAPVDADAAFETITLRDANVPEADSDAITPANSALVGSLLERLERIGAKLEKAERACATCIKGGMTLDGIVAKTAALLAKTELAYKAAVDKVTKSNALWTSLKPEQRFALERWLRFGQWEKSPGVWVKGPPPAGQWPAWYDAWTRATAAQAESIKDMVRLQAVLEETRFINFVAKNHQARCTTPKP